MDNLYLGLSRDFKNDTFYSFVEKLLFLLPNFHGLFRSMCLEILLPQADIRPQFYIELKDKGLHDMLTHRYCRGDFSSNNDY